MQHHPAGAGGATGCGERSAIAALLSTWKLRAGRRAVLPSSWANLALPLSRKGCVCCVVARATRQGGLELGAILMWSCLDAFAWCENVHSAMREPCAPSPREDGLVVGSAPLLAEMASHSASRPSTLREMVRVRVQSGRRFYLREATVHARIESERHAHSRSRTRRCICIECRGAVPLALRLVVWR